MIFVKYGINIGAVLASFGYYILPVYYLKNSAIKKNSKLQCTKQSA